MSFMRSKTYKFTAIVALMLSVTLLISSTASAQERWQRLDPKSIQGYQNLYADLNGDGHTERVTLVNNANHQYQIVVLNDQGKAIWRSSNDDNVNQYYQNASHCLLHDIDGDGNIELVFSNWVDTYAPGPDDDWLVAQPIYRWQNGKFNLLNGSNNNRLITLYTFKDSNICKFDADYPESMRSHKSNYEKDGFSWIHNLRKINGDVWGDIIVFSGNYRTLPNPRPSELTNCKWKEDKDPNLFFLGDLYKTARLETCPGGMRIVEYKQF